MPYGSPPIDAANYKLALVLSAAKALVFFPECVGSSTMRKFYSDVVQQGLEVVDERLGVELALDQPEVQTVPSVHGDHVHAGPQAGGGDHRGRPIGAVTQPSPWLRHPAAFAQAVVLASLWPVEAQSRAVRVKDDGRTAAGTKNQRSRWWPRSSDRSANSSGGLTSLLPHSTVLRTVYSAQSTVEPALISDPIGLEVLRHALQGVAEEMGSIMKRAAFSPMIKEREDRSCALFGPDGDLVAQAEHLPIHLALLASTVPAALDWYGRDRLGSGDVLLHNDPYVGGSHLPDFTMISPIYSDADELLGYAAVVAHMTDVGGAAPGGGGVHAREIIAEGVRIPPVRLYRHGQLDEDVFALLTANIRIAEIVGGDLLAEAAAVRAGERGVRRLAERYGVERLVAYMRELISYVERRTEAGVRELPEGTGEFADTIDDDGNSDEPVTVCCRVTVHDGRIHFDFTGSSKQRQGPVNASLAVVRSATYYVVRCLLDPTIPTNAGCFQLIDITAPERSVVNPELPAPVFGGSVITGQRVVDVILAALSTLMPDRITAAGTGSSNSVAFGGYDSRRCRPWVLTESIGGGSGARLTKDGLSSSRVNLLNSPNTPIEIIEQDYPIRIDRYEMRANSGGIGAYRGGLGTIKEYRVLDDAGAFVLSDRSRFGASGLLGGGPGAKSLYRVIDDDGTEVVLGSKSSFDLHPGQRLVAMTAGGGGMGDPIQRAEADIARDEHDGLQARAVATGVAKGGVST